MTKKRKINRTKTINQIEKKFIQKRNDATKLKFDTMVEKYTVRQSHKHFKQIDKLSHLANNLFNSSTYESRQAIFKHNWLSYIDLNRLFKKKRDEHSNMLYGQLKTVANAQQILKAVNHNFKNWSKARDKYKKNPNKFTGRPKLPHYHKKGIRSTIIINNQRAIIKDGYLKIACLNLKFKLSNKLAKSVIKVQQVRIIPKADIFIVEAVYKIKQSIAYKLDNNRYLSIDPGVNNVFTLATNVPHVQPIIIDGRELKSVNRYFNKKTSQLKHLHALNHQKITSNTTKKLSRYRYFKMERFAHEASNYIVQYAVSHGINTIIIGNNKFWKQSANIGKRNNQNFITIPHYKFIQKIRYKAALQGIALITTPEGYTSQTSFLDGERPCWENGVKSRKKKHLVPNKRRIKRGLFKSNSGQLINADVNGALQILRKVKPNAYAGGIEGIGLCPAKYYVNF